MTTLLIRLTVAGYLAGTSMAQRLQRSERAQSTAEYALVLAGIAGLVALVFAKTDVFQSIFTKAVAAVNKVIK